MQETGEHIPPFLIASITRVSNLHCKGCYARENHACGEEETSCSMSSDEWGKIFKEAEELGISFILLAGGEPLMRMDILKMAANYKKIMFPVFTNGTMFTSKYIELFHKNRNLVPIISLEGKEELNNRRRGEGV
jgi:MoaA/NifB/PqqE/SkfB family radical SAM enzyme